MSILDLFFEKDKSAAPTTEAVLPAQAVNTPQPTIQQTSFAAPQPVINQKIYDALKEATVSAGKETIEKFYVAVGSLASAIIDTKSRYATALSISAGFGITKESLLAIFNDKIILLEKEKETFVKEQEQQALNVAQKANSVEEIAVKVEALQKEIADLSNQKFDLQNEIEQSKFAIANLSNQFNATFELVKNELLSEKARIE